VIEAGEGNLRGAVELWQKAFNREPYRSAIGIDLALAFCESGQTEEARKYIQRVLEFNPDYGEARELLKNMSADPVKCKP
jgi:tetratricopeptide (TPR) repeat protein